MHLTLIFCVLQTRSR